MQILMFILVRYCTTVFCIYKDFYPAEILRRIYLTSNETHQNNYLPSISNLQLYLQWINASWVLLAKNDRLQVMSTRAQHFACFRKLFSALYTTYHDVSIE